MGHELHKILFRIAQWRTVKRAWLDSKGHSIHSQKLEYLQAANFTILAWTLYAMWLEKGLACHWCSWGHSLTIGFYWCISINCSLLELLVFFWKALYLGCCFFGRLFVRLWQFWCYSGIWWCLSYRTFLENIADTDDNPYPPLVYKLHHPNHHHFHYIHKLDPGDLGLKAIRLSSW